MVTVGTKITRDEREAYDRYCKENDITMSQLLRRALREYFKDKN